MATPDLTTPSNISQYAHMLGAQMLHHEPTVGAAIGAIAGIILAATSTAGLSLTLTAAFTIGLPTLAGYGIGQIYLLGFGMQKRLCYVAEEFLKKEIIKCKDHPECIPVEPKITFTVRDLLDHTVDLHLRVPKCIEDKTRQIALHIDLKTGTKAISYVWKTKDKAEERAVANKMLHLYEGWQKFKFPEKLRLEAVQKAWLPQQTFSKLYHETNH